MALPTSQLDGVELVEPAKAKGKHQDPELRLLSVGRWSAFQGIFYPDAISVVALEALVCVILASARAVER